MNVIDFQNYISRIPSDRCVVSVSGVSGAGKTTIIRKFIEEMRGKAGMIRSLTTRPKKKGDDQDYEYVTEARFGLLKENSELTWKVGSHGNLYGNTFEQYAKAMERFRVSLIAVTPETIPLLFQIIPKDHLRHFHLISPFRDELMKRLNIRGDDIQEIRNRIETSSGWDVEVKGLSKKGIPIVFIKQGKPKNLYGRFIGSLNLPT